MAVYPCDYTGHRYRQPQQSIYWTEISEHLISSYKVRLCPEHFDVVVDGIRAKMDDIDNASITSDVCELCHGERLFTQQARVFAGHKPEQQFIVDTCAACALVLGNELRVYNGEHLAPR